MLRSTLSAVVVLALLAPGAGAEEPKARLVDLAELKYAVTTADKRGENVGLIRDALTAFEKALATSAQPGAAPPELAALREAVEAVAKKGENVEGIAKELGLIEKALTGREYVRPKPPEPKPEPELPLRAGRGAWGGGAGRGMGGPNGGAWRGGGAGANGVVFSGTSITVANGTITIKARRGDVSFTVTGAVNGADSPKITIQDGEAKTETDDIKKVPEEHRPAVERLLKMVMVQRG